MPVNGGDSEDVQEDPTFELAHRAGVYMTDANEVTDGLTMVRMMRMV